MRRSIYLSERMDKDLLDYFEEFGFFHDFSLEVKKLMRDGILYRSRGQDIIRSHKPDLEGLVLKQVEISDEELDNRFNGI